VSDRISSGCYGNARINPGITVAFHLIFFWNIYVIDGIGVHYTLTSHHKDPWHDCRADKTVRNLEGAVKLQVGALIILRLMCFMILENRSKTFC
jgi:hypothetical protein